MLQKQIEPLEKKMEALNRIIDIYIFSAALAEGLQKLH